MTRNLMRYFTLISILLFAALPAVLSGYGAGEVEPLITEVGGSTDDLGPGDNRIGIYNACGVEGLARRVGTSLEAAGFADILTRNYIDPKTGMVDYTHSTTEVFYADDYKGFAETVAKVFGIDAENIVEGVVYEGVDVAVILGADLDPIELIVTPGSKTAAELATNIDYKKRSVAEEYGKPEPGYAGWRLNIEYLGTVDDYYIYGGIEYTLKTISNLIEEDDDWKRYDYSYDYIIAIEYKDSNTIYHAWYLEEIVRPKIGLYSGEEYIDRNTKIRHRKYDSYNTALKSDIEEWVLYKHLTGDLPELD